MLSVTSISSRAAGSPVTASADTTVEAKCGSSSCSPETLTATLMCLGQFIASRQASRSTHSPIETIRRVSSASGMNLTGLTEPCSLLFQRSSASKLTTFSFLASTTG